MAGPFESDKIAQILVPGHGNESCCLLGKCQAVGLLYDPDDYYCEPADPNDSDSPCNAMPVEMRLAWHSKVGDAPNRLVCNFGMNLNDQFGNAVNARLTALANPYPTKRRG